jgi:hypothetical protein
MNDKDANKKGRDDPGLPDGPQRTTGGTDPRVSGWHRDLQRQLSLLGPYLAAGRMVTFQQITDEEKAFFEELVQTVRVPDAACAVFIPPSVVQQAMWPTGAGAPHEGATGLYSIAPDAGAVAAQRCGSADTIVNALFAFPPLSPGIDVYQNGNLLAGYTYQDHRQCVEALTDILETYLAAAR